MDGKRFAAAASPALVVLRPKNRRELAYALVRDRLPIGGPDASWALVPPGMGSDEAGALWWLDGRFWWQPGALEHGARPDELTPLVPGQKWSSGVLSFSLRPFSYDLFR